MNRRTFLRNTSALGAVGLAGCMADADDNENNSGDDGTPTPDSSDDDETPTVVDSSVELVNAGCSDGDDPTASLSMDEETLTVSFSGQFTASDPCHDVMLDRAEYDDDADRLAIVVGEESTDEACVDCVGLIEFEGTVEFEGGLPSEAYVGHGDTILTASGDDGVDDPAGGGEPEAAELVEESFTVVSTTHDGPEGTADITFDEEANAVSVTGTIVGSDGCQTAALDSATYDPDETHLAVAVVTEPHEDAEEMYCTQQLKPIGYEATFSFEGGIPDRASVSHDGTGVAGAGYDSAAESADSPDGE